MNQQQVPSLKLIVVDGQRAGALSALGAMEGVEVRDVFDGTCAAYTSLTTSDLRDAVRKLLPEGASCIVVEFETWSGHGQAIDAVWLMRRGH